MRSNPNAYLSSLLTLAAVTLAVTVAYFARSIVLPLALAILLSFVLAPVVAVLERLRIGRVLSVISAVLVAAVVIVGLGWVFSNQLIDLTAELPKYRENLIAKVRDVRGAARGPLEDASKTLEAINKELDGQKPPTSPVDSWISRSLDAFRGPTPAPPAPGEPMPVKVVSMPGSTVEQAASWAGSFIEPLAMAGMVFVLVVFILLQRKELRNRIIQLFGSRHLHGTTRAIGDASQRVTRYLRAAVIVNATFGVGTAIGLWLIGLPNAILWGLVSFLFRFLPYIGPWIAAGLPILLSLAVFEGWDGPLWVIGLFIALEISISYTLEPWLYGSSIGVTSIGVILAAIFWTWLWGPVGLVLAMPLTVCLVVAAEHVPSLRFFAILLGDRAGLPLAERFYQRLLALDSDEAGELADEYLKTGSLTQLYDDVVIPALSLIERDRREGLFDADHEAAVLDAARALVDEIGEAAPALSEEDKAATRTRQRVLCVPVRSGSDQIIAAIAAQLLGHQRFAATAAAPGMLASDVVARVDHDAMDVVFLSVVPPQSTRSARYLCKRLRQRYADLPIVIGLWDAGDGDDVPQRFVRDGATYVVGTLAEAVSRIRGLAAAAVPAPQAALPVAGEPALPRIA